MNKIQNDLIRLNSDKIEYSQVIDFEKEKGFMDEKYEPMDTKSKAYLQKYYKSQNKDLLQLIRSYKWYVPSWLRYVQKPL